jgi:hypothetical protein
VNYLVALTIIMIHIIQTFTFKKSFKLMKNVHFLCLFFAIFLIAVVACNKDNVSTLNCESTTITPAIFKNNKTPQTTVLKVGLKNATAGPIVFAIAGLGNDFMPNTHTATITAGQTSVDIPITFDGTSTLTLEPIVVAATGAATGSCTVKTTIETGSSSVGLNCATTALTVATLKNDNTKQNTILKVGLNNATVGAATFAISSTGSNFSPTTFNTTLTAGQTLVEIPLVFDGATPLTTETITVSSAKFGTGTCTTNATIVPSGTVVTPVLNCATTALSVATFKNNATAQNTVLKVGLTNAIAGAVQFNIVSSGSNFTPATHKATLTAGQAFVEIPLVFDGTTTLTSETITVSSANFGTGVCTVTATIGADALPELNCTTTILTNKAFTNDGKAQNTVLKIGLLRAKAGGIKFNIVSSGTNFTPVMATATLTAGQALVEIPLIFDGTTTLTTETITVTAPEYATGSCVNTVTIAPAAVSSKVTFATVNPIFIASCSGAACHTGKAKPILVSDYAIAKLNGAKIVSEVVAKKMPNDGTTLTAAQIKLIQQWQTDGFLEK